MCVGCAITAWLDVQYSLWCLIDTESRRHPKDKEGLLRFAAPHVPSLCGTSSLPLASLNSVRFHGAFINGMFQFPISATLLPLLGQRRLCTSSLRNWTDQRSQLYIAVPSPWLVSLPLSSWNSQTHTRLQNLELFTQSILKRGPVFLSQRSTLLHWPIASESNNT